MTFGILEADQPITSRPEYLSKSAIKALLRKNLIDKISKTLYRRKAIREVICAPDIRDRYVAEHCPKLPMLPAIFAPGTRYPLEFARHYV